MIDIQQEMNQAANEAADMLWRKWLVNSWRRFPNASMGMCVAKFASRYGAPGVAIDSMPDENPREMRMTITRYMGCFYRAISDALYDGATDDQAVRMLGRFTKCTKASELEKIREDSKAKRDTDTTLRSMHVTKRAVEAKYDAHSRAGQWGVCK